MVGGDARGIVLMRRAVRNIGWVAVLILAISGAAWGQELGGGSPGGVVEAPKFDSIRILQDVKSSEQRGTQGGSGELTAGQSGASGSQTAPVAKKVKPAVHRFWDTENILLFAGVGAARGLDYASTLNIRRRGINEALLNNETVDNHAEFAAIEAATTAASVGLSYIFHATGHHRLERWTSYVHIGVTVAGAARNYALKTPHAGT
jgi:hypothetical protein